MFAELWLTSKNTARCSIPLAIQSAQLLAICCTRSQQTLWCIFLHHYAHVWSIKINMYSASLGIWANDSWDQGLFQRHICIKLQSWKKIHIRYGHRLRIGDHLRQHCLSASSGFKMSVGLNRWELSRYLISLAHLLSVWPYHSISWVLLHWILACGEIFMHRQTYSFVLGLWPGHGYGWANLTANAPACSRWGPRYMRVLIQVHCFKGLEHRFWGIFSFGTRVINLTTFLSLSIGPFDKYLMGDIFHSNMLILCKVYFFCLSSFLQSLVQTLEVSLESFRLLLCSHFCTIRVRLLD